MTSGKSTLGWHLAQYLNYHFIDLDDYITRKVGKSIVEIFEAYGEGYFRNIEQECLIETTLTPYSVIALGGGTPCYLGNMDIILECSQSIYLKVSIDEITRRASQSHTPRPLIQELDTKGIRKVVEGQIARRESFYLLANHTIESDSIDLAMILEYLPTSFRPQKP